VAAREYILRVIVVLGLLESLLSYTHKTQSRGIGCLFSVLRVETQDKQNWELKHRPKAKFSTHNHAPSSTSCCTPVSPSIIT
jgi:hypothetical protein